MLVHGKFGSPKKNKVFIIEDNAAMVINANRCYLFAINIEQDKIPMSKHISNFYAIQAALDAVRNIKYAIANVGVGA
jgi:hypothetical protein